MMTLTNENIVMLTSNQYQSLDELHHATSITIDLDQGRYIVTPPELITEFYQTLHNCNRLKEILLKASHINSFRESNMAGLFHLAPNLETFNIDFKLYIAELISDYGDDEDDVAGYTNAINLDCLDAGNSLSAFTRSMTQLNSLSITVNTDIDSPEDGFGFKEFNYIFLSLIREIPNKCNLLSFSFDIGQYPDGYYANEDVSSAVLNIVTNFTSLRNLTLGGNYFRHKYFSEWVLQHPTLHSLELIGNTNIDSNTMSMFFENSGLREMSIINNDFCFDDLDDLKDLGTAIQSNTKLHCLTLCLGDYRNRVGNSVQLALSLSRNKTLNSLTFDINMHTPEQWNFVFNCFETNQRLTTLNFPPESGGFETSKRITNRNRDALTDMTHPENPFHSLNYFSIIKESPKQHRLSGTPQDMIKLDYVLLLFMTNPVFIDTVGEDHKVLAQRYMINFIMLLSPKHHNQMRLVADSGYLGTDDLRNIRTATGGLFFRTKKTLEKDQLRELLHWSDNLVNDELAAEVQTWNHNASMGC